MNVEITKQSEQVDICLCNIIHQDVIDLVKPQLINNNSVFELAELFKSFSDPTRVKILNALSLSEMCVCDIAQLLNMGQSAISHQLRVLKQAELVKFRRDGKTMFYSLADSHVRTIIDQGFEHIEE